MGKSLPFKTAGLQIVACFEEEETLLVHKGLTRLSVIDARNGNLITGHGAGKNGDVGRCIVADVDPG